MRSLAPCKRKMAASAPIVAHAASWIDAGSLKSNTANVRSRKVAASARWMTFSAPSPNAIAVRRASATPSSKISAATTLRSDRIFTYATRPSLRMSRAHLLTAASVMHSPYLASGGRHRPILNVWPRGANRVDPLVMLRTTRSGDLKTRQSDVVVARVTGPVP